MVWLSRGRLHGAHLAAHKLRSLGGNAGAFRALANTAGCAGLRVRLRAELAGQPMALCIHSRKRRMSGGCSKVIDRFRLREKLLELKLVSVN